ncbi:MAG: glucose-6-phosphate isomerase [Gammaproteobacteria bacterium]|nr:glucose-6-phosphate isomerase [Gammaproteobacteria bacterium]
MWSSCFDRLSTNGESLVALAFPLPAPGCELERCSVSSYPALAAPQWQHLEALAANEAGFSVAEAFATDPARFEHFSLAAGDLFLDFSKNRMSPAALAGLLDLVRASGFHERRAAKLSGEAINRSENRAVLHTALRAGQAGPAGEVIAAEVAGELERMAVLVEGMRSGIITGATGKPYTDVVNIGIGGSLLGPHMASRALGRYAAGPMRNHFISDPDGCKLRDLMGYLDPETTLVIVASKTFTTLETLVNARAAKAWLSVRLGQGADRHFCGVSARADRMSEFGILPEQQFRMWDWVGGRYSVWSAIGLALALVVGMEHFRAFLAGAKLMDEHFASAEPEANLPVLFALSHVWHASFLGMTAIVNLPYQPRLKLLPAYLQQLEMESLGKRVNHAGEVVAYPVGPLIFGQVGNNAQHSFMQLMHQGLDSCLADFIAVVDDPDAPERLGLANCLAQSRALMVGNAEAMAGEPHRICPGNRPSNTLLLKELSPHILGQLLALYEHKVFVQSLVWDINAYDQWGVELGKQIATQLQAALRGEPTELPLDPSTAGLLKRLGA